MQPTQALLRSRFRKLALTTKDMNKGFYKGTRTGRMGRHTKKGDYRIDYGLVRTYVCPPLEGFKLTPFVTENVRRTAGSYRGDNQGPRNPEAYLQRWKLENGVD